ncbi:MAG: thioredoxin family protein [Chloroflexota bacterium]
MNRILVKPVSFVTTVCLLILVVACTSAAPSSSVKPARTVNANRPYDETANAQQDIDAVIALAKADKKYVMLDFGGNWCPDCIVLAGFYNAEPLKSFVEKNYHLTTIDIGQFDKNLDISARYGNPIAKGVPAVVILDADGKVVGSTANGALESARSMTAQQVIDILTPWTPKS